MTKADGPTVAAVVLAAGQGTRFAAESGGAFKLLADLDGVPLVRHVVAAAARSRARPLVVVTGHRRDDIVSALAGLIFVEAFNADYATGLASSLKAGLRATPGDAAGALILLADMPRIGSALIDTLIDAFTAHAACDAVVPVIAGRRGNPVCLGRRVFLAVETLTGDEGARRLLARSRTVIEVATSDEAVALDIDTRAALRDAQGRRQLRSTA